MRDLLAKREYTRDIPKVTLNSIWFVDADRTYRITRKKTSADSNYVAIRTMNGRGTMTLSDGTVLDIEANSLGIFQGKTILTYGAGEKGWQFYWFEFDLPESFRLQQGLTDIRLSAQEHVQLERCFVALSSGGSWECMLAEALFNYLLAEWQLRSGGKNHADGILALLERGRRQKLSIPEMAQQANMSERSFRDAVHEATGMSPKAYILKGEMAAAMELLRTTGMSISEISACFNYTSPLYFSRVFKKYYGISPQHVREGIEL